MRVGEGRNRHRAFDSVSTVVVIGFLASSSNTVASIAESLGYTNSSNFTRAFRGWTGKSPRDFRKAR
ncbi:helix-turn-helix domain-containing protein [Primorskyibacter sp. S87]|uniref:helix-turn-helix domain-containing protein n=1 Tax=Primorskyibacter sp. S87 TaxID=3415126 RepID=UPI003C7DD046